MNPYDSSNAGASEASTTRRIPRRRSRYKKNECDAQNQVFTGNQFDDYAFAEPRPQAMPRHPSGDKVVGANDVYEPSTSAAFTVTANFQSHEPKGENAMAKPENVIGEHQNDRLNSRDLHEVIDLLQRHAKNCENREERADNQPFNQRDLYIHCVIRVIKTFFAELPELREG
jgi:hypothetical protein